MDIRAISPWFGSKRTMAEQIILELGPHSAYWEPFCGSCAVLMAKDPASHETINDLHTDLINLAMVLASDRAVELYDQVSRTLCSAELFQITKKQWVEGRPPPVSPQMVTDEHILQAYHYMIMAWMGRNGAAGTKRFNYQMAIRWTPGGGAGPIRWESVSSSMPWWHRRLRSACILNMDAFELLEKIDDQRGVSIYVDPPYVKESRARGGTRYQHEFDDEHHHRLAACLRRFRHARVVVSYYDCEMIDSLYGDWTKLKCYMNKNLAVQNHRGSEGAIAPEILLLNGPSYAKDDVFEVKGLFDLSG